MILEVCLENDMYLEKSISLGAKRIELCDNLAVGGTTVSYDVAKKSIEYCLRNHVGVMCIVRPRSGSFAYSEDELTNMLASIEMFKELGATGIVIGCLDEDGWIDEQAMEKCMKVAGNLDVTFHMAFDEIPEYKTFKAIDKIIEFGISRILTHGGNLDTDIFENIHKLIEFDKYAENRIIIMPGGGVNVNNKEELLALYPFKELHGTKILHT